MSNAEKAIQIMMDNALGWMERAKIAEAELAEKTLWARTWKESAKHFRMHWQLEKRWREEAEARADKRADAIKVMLDEKHGVNEPEYHGEGTA